MQQTEHTAGARREGRSLGDVHGSVIVPQAGSTWKRWLAITGPALMVSVGYMDPGNWATDLAGGSRYEYRLLWVLLMSNIMAVILQSLAARLGIASRRDLAQANRERFPASVNYPLYALAEIAIAACDLAEVIGSAIALQLLFGLPLVYGVLLTAFDTLLLLVLMRFGIRKLEALVLALVGTIGFAFLIQIILARPEWGSLARGFVPALPDSGALYIAIGILGATVMPHNLYLHSSLVQTRQFSGGRAETRRAIRLNTIDSVLVLNVAFFVNAAILVMSAAVFYRHGFREVAEIQDAHRLLAPIVGLSIAPVLFALALLASGQGSTVTGTLAGQIVMEGYLRFRIRPWLRRLITRMIAVIPAVIVITLMGEHATGKLLVLSQVILSLQLPFAVIPLIHFVSDRSLMAEFAIGVRLRVVAWAAALIISGLNIWLVAGLLRSWLSIEGPWQWPVRLIVLPVVAAIGFLLVRVGFHPFFDRANRQRRIEAMPESIPPSEIHQQAEIPRPIFTPPAPLARVALALDFSGMEERLLTETVRFLGANKPVIGLFHVVESPSARAFGREASDRETRTDAERLEMIAQTLREAGYETQTGLGAGDPVRELARLVTEFGAELVILGGHGHRGLADLIHGTTAEALRHRIKASVLVIR